MNKLVDSIKSENKKSLSKEKVRGENGMIAHATSNNYCVDLFFKIGASRGNDISQEFLNALSENKDLALRILLWSRDCRGGAGERETFIKLMKVVEQQGLYEELNKLIALTPTIGRFKDLLEIEFFSPSVNKTVFNLFKNELLAENALAAKWTPRQGKFANTLRKALGLSHKEYRVKLKTLSNTTEQKMSSNKWDQIEYSHVPSLCMSKNTKAFKKRDEDRFSEFKEGLIKDEVKVNASVLFPHDIFTALDNGGDEIVLTKQWESLPNYLGAQNILPMIDVSGSMESIVSGSVSAMDISVALGLYISEKSSGAFKNTVMTFHAVPTLFSYNPDLSLKGKKKLLTRDCGYNTDLGLAFTNLLTFANKHKVPQSDMPKYILVLSDMQFDDYSISGQSVTANKMIKESYKQAGYDMPNIIYWNLMAKSGVPVKFDKNGVGLISGYSPAIMKAVLKAEKINPESIMLEAVMVDKYKI